MNPSTVGKPVRDLDSFSNALRCSENRLWTSLIEPNTRCLPLPLLFAKESSFRQKGDNSCNGHALGKSSLTQDQFKYGLVGENDLSDLTKRTNVFKGTGKNYE
ncbi:hypothetical protein CEXT_232861 [Caerostris extrusa]|uniref:Uncharacterized protein n=1 Tax=Caerostris extrusa TaxID=172846 RepID=A0AAV4XGE7_CAEEX|nr:hypothetical protein CEXT_232861 [Caerostris extrusa]